MLPVARSFAACEFRRLVHRPRRVGERSGKLASMLDSLAKLYEEAGRNRMKRVLILLEPIAILVIGSMIGTIILGVILAITSANDLAV